jgi:hypothetical protein
MNQPFSLRFLSGKIAAAALFLTGVAVAAPEILLYGGSGYSVGSGNTTPNPSLGTDFGAVAVSSTPVKSTFTIYNVGDQDLTISSLTVSGSSFQLTKQAPAVVPFNSNATFEISFVAPAIGIQTGSVTLKSNDPDEGSYTFAIRGQGGLPKLRVTGNGATIAAPVGAATVANGTDFGTVSLGESVTHSFFISNDGVGDMTFSMRQLLVGLGEFAVVAPAPTVIAAGTTAVVSVKFTPRIGGTVTRSVQILTNDPTSISLLIPMKATALAPEISILGNDTQIANGATQAKAADGTLMGESSIGVDNLATFYTINNTGEGDLLLGDIVMSNPDNFSAELWPSNPAKIASGAARSLKINFFPTVAGTFDSTVSIPTNDPAKPTFTFVVRATSLSSSLQVGGIVSGDTFPDTSDGTDFSNVLIGTGGLVHNFPLTNAGPGVLQIESVSVSPSTSFTVGQLFKTTLTAGETVQLPVTFDPGVPGGATARISIESASHTPFTFDVKGFGLAPALVVGPEGAVIVSGDSTPDTSDGTNFGSVTLGQNSVSHVIPVRNTGNSPLQINSVVSTNAANFSIASSLPASIPPGGTANLTIRFRPVNENELRSTITINSGNPSSDYVFTVGGFGQVRISAPTSTAVAPELTAIPFKPTSAGTFVGPLIEGFGAGGEWGGFDNFRLNADGTFTAKGNIGGLVITLKGKFAADGTWQGTQKFSDGSTAAIHIKSYVGDDGSINIQGTLIRDNEVIDLLLVRTGHVTTPSPLAGSYTLLIPADDTAAQTEPHGDGVGSITVAANGTIRSKLVLGDGTLLTKSSSLSPGSLWQFHFAPYPGSWKAGYFTGSVSFRDEAGISDVDGGVVWKRSANTKSKLYPAGFSLDRSLVGSKYIEPARGTASLPGLSATGAATLYTGASLDIAAPGATPVSWTIADKIVSTGSLPPKLTVNRKTGMITGAITDPLTKLKFTVYSAILQKQQLAGGLFKGATSTGSVTLVPEGSN